ncbi:alpha-L-rhamnosidase C-terminal domain-containing protein [Streptomyces hainanensis]|uniref:Alpha-L-rhamnosidase n=1 Tax=Streptomyces hainanensis TaxID=402648 RepID=A0A4R4TGN8_9ACTN|nr:alpha-L-rhamnosidase C-terminal domain-containing protein [Streptomyces hainanensis]TDC76801.1 hypothetical protein E1283_08855 [Streptomyces hainanensis]
MIPTTTPVTPADIARLTRARTYDPLPDDPAHEPFTQRWFALPGQWELGVLHRLVREGIAAACDVEFAPNFGRPVRVAHFRVVNRPPGSGLLVRATGTLHAGSGVTLADAGDGAVRVLATGTGPWGFGVETDGPGPAGVTVVGDGGATAFDVSADGVAWEPAAVGFGTPTTPPHELRNPVHRLPMRREGDLYALPAEVLGRVVIRCAGVPRIFAGESREEAAAGHDEEQYHDLRRRPDGRWESVHELGLRYLAVHDAEVASVEVAARAHPLRRRGAFACSDDRLTDIWVTSAYTLRQCAHGLIVDGVKRDRMPWMGDLALGAPASAYAFGDPELVERGLVALGRNTSGHVNGIVDYSLWWLVCTATFTRYFDAGTYPRRHAPHLHAFVERLAAETDPDGVLRPTPGDDAYAKPIFIDWGVEVDPERDSTALQLLWYWALESAGGVLRTAGHPGWRRWTDLAGRLRRTLHDRAWDPGAGAWREYLGPSRADSPYPNLFAVASGVMGEEVPPGVARVLLDGPRTRTPFVTAFALDALARAGHPDAAVERVRRLWGGMLDADATTFWEEFHEPDAGRYEMYGRPFGKSLCHAWAAGPARLLPEIVCGLRPTGPGWSTFTVEPELGRLHWAGAVVPVPGGEIGVVVTRERLRVDVPAGHTLVRDGREYPGPRSIAFPVR